MGMFDSIMQSIQSTGAGYTPGNLEKINAVQSAFDTGKISSADAVEKQAMVEKGSILGMTPSTFASIAGQAGAALTPKNSWQNQLGTLASQMGSQKLNQLMQAEKEKRSTDLFKQMLGIMPSKQLAQPSQFQENSGTGIKPLSLETPSLNVNPVFKS